MDVEAIEGLVKVLADSAQLTEIEVRQGDVTLRLRRPTPQARPAKKAPSSTPPAVPTAQDSGTVTGTPSGTVVVAELVGVFRIGRQQPVNVGDTVKTKQVLGQIESMRLMNDCASPVGGRIQAIFVQDGQPVEYGQPLFEIAPEENV